MTGCSILDDLIASAERIERYVAQRNASVPTDDEALFDAVLFNLQVIGEAVKRLPADALAQLPEAADRRPARLRDLIAHRYFALDPEIIGDAAKHHVRRLLQQARALRDRSGGCCTMCRSKTGLTICSFRVVGPQRHRVHLVTVARHQRGARGAHGAAADGLHLAMREIPDLPPGRSPQRRFGDDRRVRAHRRRRRQGAPAGSAATIAA